MKFLKILLCSLLIVMIVSVPCFATNANDGMYGHYISPGDYIFDDVLSFDILNDTTPESPYRITGDFVTDDIACKLIFFYKDNDGLNINFFYSSNTDSEGYFEAYRVVTDGPGWLDQDYRTITVTEGFYIYDSILYQWWVNNTTRLDAGYDSTLMDSFLSMFTFVGQWISGAAQDLTAMFWFDNSLTFVGTLAVASLAMAVSFLIIGLISRFLRFRG